VNEYIFGMLQVLFNDAWVLRIFADPYPCPAQFNNYEGLEANDDHY